MRGVVIPTCTIEGIEAMAFDSTGNLYGALDARGRAGLLEVEVPVEWSAKSSDRSPKVDRPHGFEQSDLG